MVQNNKVSGTITDSSNEGGFGIAVTATGLPFDPILPISHNNVVSNTVTNNAGGGIVLKSDDRANVNKNHLNHNGFNPDAGPGIHVMSVPGYNAKTADTVRSNTVKNSAGDGVVVNSAGNTIALNNATGDNAAHGSRYDLHDTNLNAQNQPSCATNVWTSNTWGTAGYYPLRQQDLSTHTS